MLYNVNISSPFASSNTRIDSPTTCLCSSYSVARRALYGLFMSKDRRQVIKMLEGVFRDVNRPVNFELLGVLSSLKLSQEVPVPANPVKRTPFLFEEDPDERRIRDGYLKEIV